MKKSKTLFYVYILRTSGNTLYTGQTNNLERRMKEHKSKNSQSAKYTRNFDSFELVYSEEYKTRKSAMQREFQLKQWTRTKKENLILGKLAIALSEGTESKGTKIRKELLIKQSNIH